MSSSNHSTWAAIYITAVSEAKSLLIESMFAAIYGALYGTFPFSAFASSVNIEVDLNLWNDLKCHSTVKHYRLLKANKCILSHSGFYLK